MNADQAVQAVLADIARRLDPASDADSATDLVMGDDGTFHEVVHGPASDVRRLSDAEILAILREHDAG
jgi:hypothetical protein